MYVHTYVRRLHVVLSEVDSHVPVTSPHTVLLLQCWPSGGGSGGMRLSASGQAPNSVEAEQPQHDLRHYGKEYYNFQN